MLHFLRLFKTFKAYETALNTIANVEGKFCGDYDRCEHPGCISAFNSWAIAKSALEHNCPPNNSPSTYYTDDRNG